MTIGLGGVGRKFRASARPKGGQRLLGVGAPGRTGRLRRSLLGVSQHSAFRFTVSGVTCAAYDMLMLYVLHGLLGLLLAPATFFAVASSFVLNFALNRIWSFGSVAPAGPQFLRYLTLAGSNWIFTTVMVTGLAAAGLHYLVAKCVTLAIAAVLNYIGYRIWVFR